MGNAATGRSEGAREVVSSEVDSVGTMKQHRDGTGGALLSGQELVPLHKMKFDLYSFCKFAVQINTFH